MANFKTNLPTRQEQFSIAWLYAIASVAGYSIEHVKWDNDSVDAQIHQKGEGEDFPIIDQISVQLKCTYTASPKGGQITYLISRKNYDDLKGKRQTPRILILLQVPKGLENWLKHQDESILLKNCADWTSLSGCSKTNNSSKVPVSIPVTQKLTVNSLSNDGYGRQREKDQRSCSNESRYYR